MNALEPIVTENVHRLLLEGIRTAQAPDFAALVAAMLAGEPITLHRAGDDVIVRLAGVEMGTKPLFWFFEPRDGRRPSEPFASCLLGAAFAATLVT